MFLPLLLLLSLLCKVLITYYRGRQFFKREKISINQKTLCDDEQMRQKTK